MANYPGTKLAGVAYKLRKKMKNSFYVVVLQTEDDKVQIYQNVKSTCRVFGFFCPLNLLFCSVVVGVAVAVVVA